ncbi:KilA-N domain-containing protein [Vibrio algivorus]|uniref:KilA-N domain-containing protein n=1 Tax=Vibrio algivorus TaxID=1667024 RepID=A0ABQ6EL86_9VIBR|nr:KilA-N domain-containing protein [Vibrio algivorus]GLT13888.1 hypothetical protein GCM10007931_08620 [Vibrio algivorus]
MELTKELIQEIKLTPDVVLAYKVNKGGSYPGVWVCKDLVYYYTMWISPKFHLQVIRTFDEVTNQQKSYIGMINQLSAVFEEENNKASKAGTTLNRWKDIKREINNQIEQLKADSQLILFN